MSMNTPVGNITQTTPIKDFKELDEMQNEQYLLGIDNNAVGNGSKISLGNLINSSMSADNGNLITKGTDDRLFVNTPVEIGDLSSLTTINKSTLVAAINEVDSDITTEATTRANADNNLQTQIDAITAASDVTDIVGTYAELQAYDTTGLPDNSIIKVLQDESRQNETTYYRWVITGGVGAWVLIGEEGPYYTISQADNKFATKATVGDLNNLATSDKSSIVNAMNELASVLDPTQTADYIKNSKAIYSGEVSENASILPQIKEMAHSTFDRSKFTVVGSPNITDDGIASGFSNSNYLTLNTGITLSKDTYFKIYTRFKTPEAFTKNGRFLGRSANLSFGHTLAGKISGVFIGASLATSSLQALLTNTVYDAVLIYDNTGFYVKYKTETESTYTSTTPVEVTSDSTVELAGDIGNQTNDTTAYFTGSIDLKQFSVTVDGVEVFSGNKTGIDTIKPDDYTVAGTPTISADGIASGFSNSNYLTISKDVINQVVGKPFVIEFESTFHQFTSTASWYCLGKNPWASSDANWSGNIIHIGHINTSGNYFMMLALNDGTTVMTYIPSSSLNNKSGLRYKCRAEFNGTNYFKLTLTFENGTVVYNDKITEQNITLATSTTNAYVMYKNDGTEIDLNAFKIYVDGNLVYQPCLKIPYTESKTGSKIADSIYRDRVADMYEQFGYAPYYTLSDTDFTLPQGELYGYLEKRARDIAHPVGVPFYRFDDTINDDEVRLEGAEVDKGLYLAIEEKLSALCTAGSTSDKICLPDFRNRTLWGANDFGYVEAGLPNITGHVGAIAYGGGDLSGCFGNYTHANGEINNTNADADWRADFNASWSNSIYGNSTTVQPSAVKVRWLARWK